MGRRSEGEGAKGSEFELTPFFSSVPSNSYSEILSHETRDSSRREYPRRVYAANGGVCRVAQTAQVEPSPRGDRPELRRRRARGATANRADRKYPLVSTRGNDFTSNTEFGHCCCCSPPADGGGFRRDAREREKPSTMCCVPGHPQVDNLDAVRTRVARTG